jgi:curli biogenesis system outer membrane secretion channel CsgG
VGGGLGGYSKTPVEKAVRVALSEAVNFIVTKTPQQYYHYQQ